MYESEAEAIRKLAEKPCIILGRCASDILKDRMNVLNIFVCADKEDRIRRIMGKDNLSYDEAKEKVEKTDEERASYYYEHTGKTWGDVNDYHMIMDTSELGVENCADILMHYFEKCNFPDFINQRMPVNTNLEILIAGIQKLVLTGISFLYMSVSQTYKLSLVTSAHPLTFRDPMTSVWPAACS